MFPCLTVFLILIVVFAVLRRHATRSYEERQEAFWTRENEANNTRKADLSQITFLQIEPESFPLHALEGDEELLSLKKEILDICPLKMLNLNGLSNTELKLKYGPQNLEALTEYGENFARLEKWICQCGSLLMEKGLLEDAIHVLEKGIGLGSDISKNYVLLGNAYQKTGHPEKIEALIPMAEKLGDFTRPNVLRTLNALLDSPA